MFNSSYRSVESAATITRWLAAGGSEQGLMTQAGWADRKMLDRYTRATASERAMDEARGLGLGDL